MSTTRIYPFDVFGAIYNNIAIEELCMIYMVFYMVKGEMIPLQARCGPEGG